MSKYGRRPEITAAFKDLPVVECDGFELISMYFHTTLDGDRVRDHGRSMVRAAILRADEEHGVITTARTEDGSGHAKSTTEDYRSLKVATCLTFRKLASNWLRNCRARTASIDK
jgi:hypothetical protein